MASTFITHDSPLSQGQPDLPEDAASKQYVYRFGGGHAEVGAEARDLLGNKGANLCELARVGAPVPPGFVISTDACRHRMRHGAVPKALADQMREGIRWIEQQVGRTLGDPHDPLLLSVRSGARDSMPGMMDTVLNIGATASVLGGLAGGRPDGQRFAYDIRRRLLQMFGSVVAHVEADRFERVLDEVRGREGVASDTELSSAAMAEVVSAFERIAGASVPDDPWLQLERAVLAVFDSWNGERAQAYRAHHGIPDDWGTGVTVQAMVFGNTGAASASGVAFSRNPASGAPEPFGEYLVNAQGEDVVSGARTPRPLPAAGEQPPEPALAAPLEQLREWLARLDAHYRDMQDVEFTIEGGHLWLLQTRSGKRSPGAGVRIAVELAQAGTITTDEAVVRVAPSSLDELRGTRLAARPDVAPIATGLPASPGVAVGRVTFDVATAVRWREEGTPVVLVREHTSAADVSGMIASVAIVTAQGGMTSHAAVVARGMGVPCISGCRQLAIDEPARRATAGDAVIAEGDWLTVDAHDGALYAGELATLQGTPGPELDVLLGWADERRRLRVLANADTPEDAQRAVDNGAEGIGLCRTEHMFFGRERLTALAGYLLAQDDAARVPHLAVLRAAQRADFAGILRVMHGRPTTIRLLDPPLHEFLPKAGSDEARALARDLGVEGPSLDRAIERLHEQNPMMGNRGVRLALAHPDLYRMQCEALAEGAIEAGYDLAQLSIMLPLVMMPAELRYGRHLVTSALEAALDRQDAHAIQIGTMIELPRACAVAATMSRWADFFSFGTNDLTQMTMGLSRDDTAELIDRYVEAGLLAGNPFQSIDEVGVGRLMQLACDETRAVHEAFEIGVCGEHGGDPVSIRFFERLGVGYVSCSPPRLQVARLAAAQAAIRGGAAAA